MFPHRITGWHVAAIFGSAFAVIIGVNLTLAFKAVSTFPGLETKNSYVASQHFDRDRSAQQALGWTVAARLENDQLVLTIDDDRGPVAADIVTATLGRATHVGEDRTPEFHHNGSAFVAAVPGLPRGNWNLRLEARAQSGTLFRQRVIVGAGS